MPATPSNSRSSAREDISPKPALQERTGEKISETPRFREHLKRVASVSGKQVMLWGGKCPFENFPVELFVDILFHLNSCEIARARTVSETTLHRNLAFNSAVPCGIRL